MENAVAKSGLITNVSDSTFAKEVYESDLPVLVDFMAEWCPPCKKMEPTLSELAAEYSGKLKFVRLDVDESPDVSSALGVTSMPTFMILRRDKALASTIGSMPANRMRSWIEQALTRK